MWAGSTLPVLYLRKGQAIIIMELTYRVWMLPQGLYLQNKLASAWGCPVEHCVVNAPKNALVNTWKEGSFHSISLSGIKKKKKINLVTSLWCLRDKITFRKDFALFSELMPKEHCWEGAAGVQEERNTLFGLPGFFADPAHRGHGTTMTLGIKDWSAF